MALVNPDENGILSLLSITWAYCQDRHRVLLSLGLAMSMKRTVSVRESQEFEESFSQETDLGEGGSQESIVCKRPRRESSKNGVEEYTGPTNKVLPVNIQFPPKHPGTTRLAAWNVSGLIACEKKVCFVFNTACSSILTNYQGFKHYVAAEDPDILIITETKVDLPASLTI